MLRPAEIARGSLVSPTIFDIDSRIEIGMRAVATDSTAKRLLVGPVGSVYIITHTALLRGVGAPDSDLGGGFLVMKRPLSFSTLFQLHFRYPIYTCNNERKPNVRK